MTKTSPALPRRKRLPGDANRNIYTRPDGTFEVGWKDGAGKQRWRTVEGGVTAARALRDEMLAARARGERAAPNPKLKVGDAADRWLAGPVQGLRPPTRAIYANHLEQRIRPRWGAVRLDRVTADDVVRMMRECRAAGLSEWTIRGTLNVLSAIFDHAVRRLGWAGQNPVKTLLPSERPRTGATKRRTIFAAEQIAETVQASAEPWRTVFLVAALTGARLSEVIGLTWGDVQAADLDAADIEFGAQVDRAGVRQMTKTDGSARTVPILRELAVVLAAHRLRSRDTRDDAFVFATASGRAFSQRNVHRALRAAQKRARNADGLPTFPVLHKTTEDGDPVKPPRGALPSMHGFRHSFATLAFAAGESIDEVAFLLGHANANVTRAVYVREVADARRAAMRRNRIASQYEGALAAATGSRSAAEGQAGAAVRPIWSTA